MWGLGGTHAGIGWHSGGRGCRGISLENLKPGNDPPGWKHECTGVKWEWVYACMGVKCDGCMIP